MIIDESASFVDSPSLTAASFSPGHSRSNDVSSLHGSSEKHDFSLWAWDMPVVWRQSPRVPNLSKDCGEKSFALQLSHSPVYCEQFQTLV